MQRTPYADGSVYERGTERNHRAARGGHGVDVNMRGSEMGNGEYVNVSACRSGSSGCACARAIAALARRRVTEGWVMMRRVGTDTIQAWCDAAKQRTKGAIPE